GGALTARSGGGKGKTRRAVLTDRAFRFYVIGTTRVVAVHWGKRSFRSRRWGWMVRKTLFLAVMALLCLGLAAPASAGRSGGGGGSHGGGFHGGRGNFHHGSGVHGRGCGWSRGFVG